MISAGRDITSATDVLLKVNVEVFYHSLINPRADNAARIRQLRLIHELDARQYAVLKRQLPYVVCGIFNPPHRHTDNFAYTQHFILDIDHLTDKQLDMNELRRRVQGDQRVMLCFASPSNDGLKVMFRLTERCYDAGLYSIFYKAFAREFSLQYGLQQVIDARTSDVTRACFISVDPQAYYNPDAVAVNLAAVVDADNPMQVLDMLHEQQQLDKQERQQERQQQADQPRQADPSDDIMDRIRQQLQLKRAAAQPTVRDVFVPQVLNDIIDGLRQHVEQTGLVVNQVTNIQYGKKVSIAMGLKKAEVNVFYGKRGFKVVQTPKAGTDATLNDLSAQLIQAYIDTL